MNELEVKELLRKAKQSIDAAKLLYKDGFHDFSASRSYYAMFYTVEALLLYRNLTFSKHSATVAAFGKEYIKTNLLPDKLHQYLLEAFDLRNIGDYGAMNSIPHEKANELIQNAEEMIDIIQAYLFSSP